MQEDKNDPGLDGKLTRKVQSVSQGYLGPNTAGYSDEDLYNLKKEIQDLVEKNSTTKAAVLRTTAAYQTRFEAELG